MARKKDPAGAKAQILDAALKLFSEKGYEATTMQNIVDLSGLSKGAIYYHFKDKTEIYKSLYESLNRNPFSSFSEVEKDKDLTATERLEAFCISLITAPEKNIYASAVRNHKNPNLVELTLRITVLEASKYIARLLEEGVREGLYSPGDTQMLAELFCLTIDMWMDPSINEQTTEELFDRKMDTIQKTFELHGFPIVTPRLREILKHYFTANIGFANPLSETEDPI